MLHQKEILEWLKMFSVNQIKHFLTIKSLRNLHYIERLMNNQEDSKPSQRWIHGYSERHLQDVTSIYIRENYRYKKNKDKKKAADEIFFENITASRTNPYALSVRKQFIKNGKLSECMLTISEDQIFNCITSENYETSAWFKITDINSLSMWIIRMFELEIFEAYSRHESIHSINHFVFAEQKLNREKIKSRFESCISKHIERTSKIEKGQKVDKGKEIIQISKEEGPYLVQKCMEKLDEQGRDIGEIIFEDIWFIYDNHSKVSKLYREICEDCMQQYPSYLIDVKVQEIESYQNSKKKKKKAKKPKQQIEALKIPSEQIKLEKKKSQVKPQVKSQVKAQVSNTLKQSKLANQIQTKIQIEKVKKDYKQKEAQLQRQKLKSRQGKKVQEAQEHLNEKKLNQQRQKQEQKKFKKIINERINENIYVFYQQLYQSSLNFDKYRKSCVQAIRGTIQQLKIDNQWRLELFGSSSINFALKQSDLDLVLIIDDEKSCTLVDIYELFKVKQWVRQCNIIMQARVPIVQFQVSLSQLKQSKVKDLKKLMNSVIHVDISISYKSSPHEGLKNTLFLKEIFENHPNLMTVCLILKELLRINELNKPFYGGIGSYVLVILVHNILRLKNVDLDDNLMNQLKVVSKYLTTEFQPFITLVTPFKNSMLKSSSQLSLNIEDPHQRALLHTSARLINEIISLFKQLNYTLDIIELQVSEANIEQRKRMKKIFFQNWNVLFKKADHGDERSM